MLGAKYCSEMSAFTPKISFVHDTPLPGGLSTNPQGVELEASSTPKPPSCTTLKSYFSYMANSYTDAEVNLAPTLPPDPLYPLYAPLRR